ncbi:MAG: YegS/Rv2252/BmrU family lipid kinase [Bacteroidia bacterium]|nr:YegS/Rv2252/BmrU family lipid kinase [Bacteroidia bacterium]
MKNALIISNPVAGKGKTLKIINKVFEILQNFEFNYTLYLTKSKCDYQGIQNTISKNSNIDLLIISGGDGTLNDVVNALPDDYKTPIIILPCGSGNDFATYLYEDKTIDEILRILKSPKELHVNIGICNGKKFINGLGIGFDGWVAKKANERVKYIPPILKYYAAILSGIFTFKSFDTNLGKALIIAIANGPTYGGGFKIAPNADPTDWYFDLWHIKPIPIIKRIFYLDIIKNGKHNFNNSFFEFRKIDNLKIECELQMPAHLDGEYFESSIFEISISKFNLLFLK